ncbi:hypothetical protein FKM82_027001 [Ascaphus truei]
MLLSTAVLSKHLSVGLALNIAAAPPPSSLPNLFCFLDIDGAEIPCSGSRGWSTWGAGPSFLFPRILFTGSVAGVAILDGLSKEGAIPTLPPRRPSGFLLACGTWQPSWFFLTGEGKPGRLKLRSIALFRK